MYVLKQESQNNNLRHEGARTWPACIGSVRKPNHILNQPGWGASLYISQVDMYQVLGIFGLNWGVNLVDLTLMALNRTWFSREPKELINARKIENQPKFFEFTITSPCLRL